MLLLLQKVVCRSYYKSLCSTIALHSHMFTCTVSALGWLCISVENFPAGSWWGQTSPELLLTDGQLLAKYYGVLSVACGLRDTNTRVMDSQRCVSRPVHLCRYFTSTYGICVYLYMNSLGWLGISYIHDFSFILIYSCIPFSFTQQWYISKHCYLIGSLF